MRTCKVMFKARRGNCCFVALLVSRPACSRPRNLQSLRCRCEPRFPSLGALLSRGRFLGGFLQENWGHRVLDNWNRVCEVSSTIEGSQGYSTFFLRNMTATEAQKQTNKLCGNPCVTPKAKHNQQPTKPYILSHADGGGKKTKA